MKRTVGIIFTLVSLICCIAFAICWIRSFSRWEAIDWHRYDHGFQIRSASGTLCLQREQMSEHPTGNYFFVLHELPPAPIDWSKSPIPYTDVIGIITPEMSFWDRFWWNATPIFQWGGFAVYQSVPTIILNQQVAPAESGCWSIDTPYWFWCAMTALLPLWKTLKLLLRINRRRCGRCPSCNYDLRATPSACPECGLTMRT